MPRKRSSTVLTNVVTIFALALISAGSAWAGPKYKVLHAFGAGKDGGGLWGSLAFDAQGNLYGTTSGGGAYGDGTVFELTLGSNGIWSETILHSFPSFSDDGGGPTSTPILDAAGNLYASTEGGGTHYSGTVFELAQGSWTETILYNFCAMPKCSDGASPSAGLIMDGAGNLYGTAFYPFELSPSSGQWTLTVLHKFPSHKGDGTDAYQGVILDAAGNVYGATEGGGTGTQGCIQTGCGMDYELHHKPDGKWKEIALHNFGTGGDNMLISGGLLFDGMGNLYGATDGGVHAQGAIYRLSRGAGGHWKAAIQYSFKGGANGGGPAGSLVMDGSGSLYGVTVNGGDPFCGCGVVYRLAPGTNGKWKYTVLHRFTGNDGAQPYAAPILDSKGSLYGTTATGGAAGAGVVFELTP
jgi:uncharacterized repeat protein (TIGR03803 family)